MPSLSLRLVGSILREFRKLLAGRHLVHVEVVDAGRLRIYAQHPRRDFDSHVLRVQ